MFSALIIDADGSAPNTIKEILAPFGFEFTVTENGPEAVNVARTTAPDLILIRAELPLTSGFSVCNRLRRHAQTRQIPLVIYSSDVSQEVLDQHRKLKTAANEYLKMPLTSDVLLTAVRRFVKIDRGTPPPKEPAPARAAPTPTAQRIESDYRGQQSGSYRIEPTPETRAPSGPTRQARGNAASYPRDDRSPSGGFRAEEPPAAPAEGQGAETGAFRSQREVLALKSALNATKRELLAVNDELEVRERAILDSKRKNRELQAQASEQEAQLLTVQEKLLAAREQVEALSRDKSTLLKREEGLKNRLENTQRKVRELEDELNAAHTQFVEDLKQARLVSAELSAKVDATQRQVAELEQERDGLTAELVKARDRVDELTRKFEASLERVDKLEGDLHKLRADSQAQLELEREQANTALSAAHEANEAAFAQAKLSHAEAIGELTAQLEEVREQAAIEAREAAVTLEQAQAKAQEERERLAQALEEAETSAREEIGRLSEAMTEAEQESRSEIERLKEAMMEAEREAREKAEADAERIAKLESQVEGLTAQLDEARETLAARNEAGARAQQALAVALKLLEHHNLP
ncbi:MAG: response regulator [Myxococcales bacterium]|nr:response regulator [Myxococcales bacterium]